MKVLILHQHFNTPGKGGPLRSYYLARALVKQGLWPVIITAHREPKYKAEISEGMEVHYLPIAYDNSYGFYKRSWAFVKYLMASINLSRKFRDVSCCYAISVPLTVGVAATFIKKLYNIPFVFEVGDLWPDAPIQLGVLRNKGAQNLLLRLEKSIYRQAAHIVALSDPIADAIKAKSPSSTVTVVPNMADTSYFKPTLKVASSLNIPGDKLVVSYIGATGFANGLDGLLECARACQLRSVAVHFVICGEGAQLESLKLTVTRLGLENVSFIPFQNRDGVKRVLEATDAVFISYRPVRILETGSPNKYFDGLAAGKLIITNFGGWIADEILRERCGITIEPHLPSSLADRLAPFISDPALLGTYQQNARHLAERKYSREMLAAQLAALVMKIKKPGGSGLSVRK